VFVVRDGVVLTPHEKYVLPGVSRQTVIDMAKQEGVPLREADIDLYDAYNADEMFLTSTSLCICPVVKINGVQIGPKEQVWGPVTQRLTDAYKRFVNHDFVAQYTRRYVEGMQARAF
jgi:branched-chain amino acid aminotransferase